MSELKLRPPKIIVNLWVRALKTQGEGNCSIRWVN
jgi:hypothetical protein